MWGADPTGHLCRRRRRRGRLWWEAIWNGDRVVGRVTSGGWGHRVGSSLALGYVEAELAGAGTNVAIEILGEKRPATVVRTPYYDPDNMKLRG